MNLLILMWQESGLLRRIWTYLNRLFEFGQIKFSAATLFQGLVILVATLVLARYVSSLLERRLSRTAQIDQGLRYTIGRLVKYVVTIIGVLLFLQVSLNVNLTSLAVVFTALSVGIGFGLQYIAADIASGFILLFERPIRIGDHITIGDAEGNVQSINMRTTIVTTNDRIAIIVPNSKLVSQQVVNWSYRDPHARIAIPIGVAPDSDIDHVTKTLLEAASGVDRVLTKPPAKVQFMKFGDFSLDFRLLVWTRDPTRHPQIRSDINYRIAHLFRERGIQTARPVQELRLQPGDVGLKDLMLSDQQDGLKREDGE